MGTFRGLICQNENDYNQKERLIHDKLYADFSEKTEEVTTTVTDYDDNDVPFEKQVTKTKVIKAEYTSEYFAGGRGVPDLWTTDGKPILVEPKRSDWVDLMPTLPLNFQDLDESIIDKTDY